MSIKFQTQTATPKSLDKETKEFSLTIELTIQDIPVLYNFLQTWRALEPKTMMRAIISQKDLTKEKKRKK